MAAKESGDEGEEEPTRVEDKGRALGRGKKGRPLRDTRAIIGTRN